MKAIYKAAFVIFSACLLGGLISYSNSFTRSQIRPTDQKTGKSLHYHFVMIAEDMSDSFWQAVKAGAQKSGDKNQAAIEFDGPMIQNEEEEFKYLNIAIAANVDGIALYVPNKTKFRPLINEATEKGIPIVTVESDDVGSSRKAYIGPNSYDVGTAQGTLVTKAVPGKSNVALILGGNYAVNSDLSDSLLKGFRNSILPNPEIKLKSIQNSSTGYFKAENIIRNILYEHPDIDTVVCTSADDTFEVVQVLIDLNRTGSVDVIGYSDSDQIREYIKNGVIYGSVYEDPQDTGYQSIDCLTKLKNGKQVSTILKTGVFSLTKNNLASQKQSS